MPQLASGANVTLTLGDTDSVTVTTTGSVLVEAVSGLGVVAGRLVYFSGTRTLGPYSAGTLRLTAEAAECKYEVTDGAAPVRSEVADVPLASDFLASGFRGMGVSDSVDAPLSAAYWALFGRFGANSCRTGLGVLAATRGGEYYCPDSTISALEANIAAALALGCRTIVTVVPRTTGGIADGDRRDKNFWTSPTALSNYGRFLAWLAGRLKGNAGVLAIDMINEPGDTTDGFTQTVATRIQQAQSDWTKAIRLVDPNRTVIVEPAADGQPLGFRYLTPIPFENVVYSAHVYAPQAMTHSYVGAVLYTGAYPSTLAVGGGLPYLDLQAANSARLVQETQPIVDFQKRYGGLPIYIGEFSCTPMTPSLVAPAYLADAVALFEANGWSWSYHQFGFPANPWSPLVLPGDPTNIDYNNGSSSGQVSLRTVTGAADYTTGAVSDGRCNIAPIANALAGNALYKTAPAPDYPTYFAGEDCTISTSSRVWTTTLGQAGGGTVTLNSTANPKTAGGKHFRFEHNATPGTATATVLMKDEGALPNASHEFFLSFDVCIGVAIGGGKSITLASATSNGSGSGCYWKLANVAGTNVWTLEIYKGSSFGTRPFLRVNGLTFATGAYSNLKFGWLCNQNTGRMRVWQDRVLLVDINAVPTTTNDAVDFVWRPEIGYIGDQTGQIVDIANVLFSVGADAT